VLLERICSRIIISLLTRGYIMTTFDELGVIPGLVEALKKLQITTPTPVQEATISLALAGEDILASAQTGSGKTLAYSLPLIMKLLQNPQSTGLILAPTRELALQVEQMIRKVSSFKTVLLIGGMPMGKQLSDLRRRPQIIVGTPGRINDHLERGTLNLGSTRMLVIDEADRMLDMGFGIQLDRIAEYLPENRQTLMFSATLPPNIDKLSKKYLRDPKRVAVDTSNQPAPKIKQEIIHTRTADKFGELLKQLDAREGSIIVFVRTRRATERLSKELNEKGHLSDAIHGDLPQRRRDRVIQGFRSSKSRIMVATDVAARGLDIPHVMHVINYDLPECPEDYIHRIGRTGRAGAEGNALCFIAPEERYKWSAIAKLMDPTAVQDDYVPAPKKFGGPKRRPPFRSFRSGGGGGSGAPRGDSSFRSGGGGGAGGGGARGESNGGGFRPKKRY